MDKGELVPDSFEARVGPYRDPDDPAHNAQPLGEGMADGKRIVDQNLWG